MKKLLFFIVLSNLFASSLTQLVDDFERQCNSGNATTCGVVGGIYQFAFDNYGVKQDFKKARKFYEKGCEMGNFRSCSNLGYMYEKAQGVKQNLDKATQLYKKSCDGGDDLGCQNLSSLNLNTKGNQADVERIINSCKNGDMLSCANIGMIFFSTSDYEKAASFLAKACLLGNKDANTRLNQDLKEIWENSCDIANNLIKILDK